VVIIGTSAVVAILQDEPERARFVHLIAADDVRLLSAVSRVECTCVVEGRKREAGRADLERLLAEAGVEIAEVTALHAEIACEAFRRFGKGRHAPALDIGDCFAYALAKASGEPRLLEGDDFARTDITSAT
jgi:ribonuclease VapC